MRLIDGDELIIKLMDVKGLQIDTFCEIVQIMQDMPTVEERKNAERVI